MKIFAINGSPRKSGNTAEILQKVLEGAASAGAETELIHLGELQFSGCKSCFCCKLKNGKSYGKCALSDDLTPILEKIIQADGIVMGSPIYFSAESGAYRNFLERLFFPFLQYSDPVSSIAPCRLQAAFVYTMNVKENDPMLAGYKAYLENTHFFPQLIFNSTFNEALYVHDTFQFSDYSLYESSMFDAASKAEVRKTQFPQDCLKAVEMGKKLAESCRK